MRASIYAEGAQIDGASASVNALYAGPEIILAGVSNGKRGEIRILMHPAEAIELAMRLLDGADKHGADTRRSVDQAVKRLARKTAPTL